MKPLCCFLGVVLLLTGATGCKRAPSHLLQGYAEGEFVYVSSPLPGKQTKLSVQRGKQASKSEDLFALESVAETAARDEAMHRLAQAKATLEDAKKGRRPTETRSMEAQ